MQHNFTARERAALCDTYDYLCEQEEYDEKISNSIKVLGELLEVNYG